MRGDIQIDSLGDSLRRIFGGGIASIAGLVVLLIIAFNSF